MKWVIKYEDYSLILDGEQYLKLKQLAIDNPVSAEEMAKAIKDEQA